MIRYKESLTTTTKVLLCLLAAKEGLAEFTAYPSLQKAVYPEYHTYKKDRRLDFTLRRLEKQGWLKTEYSEAKKIISLTQKGELEALFTKAYIGRGRKDWDGKWRIVMFDIPEAARDIRQRLRLILRSFGFHALQGSVYVYPFPLSQDSILYLKKSGLLRYIRIARADFDDDADLVKQYKLKVPKKHGRLK